LIIVRIPKRVARRWVARHEKDGLDEPKLIMFIRAQYEFGNYERTEEGLLLFVMRFQRRGGKPMKAELWVRERKVNELVELILVRGHVEPI